MTSIYPSPERPYFGTFVRTQVESVRRAGVEMEVHVLESRWQKLAYPSAALWLRRRLARGGIDVVHAYYGYVGLVARTQWKVPLVVTYEGSDVFGDVDEQGRPARFAWFEAGSSRTLARLADQVIVQTSEMAAHLPRRDVHVIPHEVDFELFRPHGRGEARQALGLDPERRYLLFGADTSITVKNFPLAKAASDRLREQGVDNELLVVAHEPQERLVLYMSACDALIFTSHREGSPNLVKQTMACNLPIVSVDVGDVREVIGSTSGCHICDASPDALAEGLKDILARRERTDGRNDIRRLESGAVAKQVIDVYELALAGRRARRRSLLPLSRRA